MPTALTLPPLSSVTPSDAILDGWKVVAGAPTMRTWVLHTATDGTMMSGYWEATPGTYHATYDAYEFCHLIAGRMTITPDGGAPVQISAGQAFVIEKDFVGTWDIHETVKKHFCFRLG
jgi:uncharacterized protein